jgi:class 3 adenylate cyclase
MFRLVSTNRIWAHAGEYDTDMNMIWKIRIHIILWPALTWKMPDHPSRLFVDASSRCIAHHRSLVDLTCGDSSPVSDTAVCLSNRPDTNANVNAAASRYNPNVDAITMRPRVDSDI